MYRANMRNRASKATKAFLHGMYVGTTADTTRMREIQRTVEANRLAVVSLKNADDRVRSALQKGPKTSPR